MVENVANPDEIVEDPNALQPEDVLQRLREDLGREGYQRALDDDHVATFVQRGPKLVVAFETLENVLNVYRDEGPIGLDLAEDRNWSLLHIAARKDSWFRASSIYAYFDELVDDCFFEDFDQVAFYGASTAAYAACAFSVASPGANVLAITPQATLDSERAGWDQRFPRAKFLTFDDRYGYAPDMVEGARKVYILFDPFCALDHVHASLFHGPNVTRLKCRHMDGQIELALRDMAILHQIVESALNGDLGELSFYQLLRKRRTHNRYLRSLLHALARRNQPERMAYLCRHVLDSGKGGPVFRRTLKNTKKLLLSKGPLPDWLTDTSETPKTPTEPQKTL